jgi:hypothetical protein
VIVPPALFAAPERPALIELGEIGFPAVVVLGAEAFSVVVSLATTVEGMPSGHETLDPPLVVPSPL